jgi:two-component system, LytTR family, response regulator
MKSRPNKKVNLDQIAYCQAAENYCLFVWPNGNKTLKARTLKVFAPRLEAKGWCRIHRSYLVNPQFVTNINAEFVLMDNGAELPISRRKKSSVLAWAKS